MKTIFSFALILAAVFVRLTPASADVVSTFDANDEGWTILSFTNLSTDNFGIAGTYTAGYSATGGNPGGYIFNTDPDGGDATFSAPAAFLGNKLAALGTNFTYDLSHDGANNYTATDLIFVGNGGQRLLWQSSPALAPGTPFITVTVSLAPSAQWHVNTSNGALATNTDFQNIFASLTAIYIRGEYTTGSETDRLDNVVLVPEPGSCALVALGAGALTLAYRRRQGKLV